MPTDTETQQQDPFDAFLTTRDKPAAAPAKVKKPPADTKADPFDSFIATRNAAADTEETTKAAEAQKEAVASTAKKVTLPKVESTVLDKVAGVLTPGKRPKPLQPAAQPDIESKAFTERPSPQIPLSSLNLPEVTGGYQSATLQPSASDRAAIPPLGPAIPPEAVFKTPDTSMFPQPQSQVDVAQANKLSDVASELSQNKKPDAALDLAGQAAELRTKRTPVEMGQNIQTEEDLAKAKAKMLKGLNDVDRQKIKDYEERQSVKGTALYPIIIGGQGLEHMAQNIRDILGDVTGFGPQADPSQSLTDITGFVPPETQREHPYATGLTQAVSGLGGPENVTLIASTMGVGALPALTKAGISAYFAAQMMKGVYDTIPGIQDAAAKKDWPEVKRLATLAGVNTAFAGLAGGHAINEAGLGPKVGPSPYFVKSDGGPVNLTRETAARLRDMGYTNQDISNMNASDLQTILGSKFPGPDVPQKPPPDPAGLLEAELHRAKTEATAEHLEEAAKEVRKAAGVPKAEKEKAAKPEPAAEAAKPTEELGEQYGKAPREEPATAPSSARALTEEGKGVSPVEKAKPVEAPKKETRRVPFTSGKAAVAAPVETAVEPGGQITPSQENITQEKRIATGQPPEGVAERRTQAQKDYTAAIESTPPGTPTPGEKLAEDIRQARADKPTGVSEGEALQSIMRDPKAYEKYKEADKKTRDAMLVQASRQKEAPHEEKAAVEESKPVGAVNEGATPVQEGLPGQERVLAESGADRGVAKAAPKSRVPFAKPRSERGLRNDLKAIDAALVEKAKTKAILENNDHMQTMVGAMGRSKKLSPADRSTLNDYLGFAEGVPATVEKGKVTFGQAQPGTPKQRVPFTNNAIKQNEVIATQNIGGKDWEYRVGRVPEDQLDTSEQGKGTKRFQAQIRPAGSAEWDSAYFGKYPSREAALKSVVARNHDLDRHELKTSEPTITKALEERRSKQEAAQAEAESKRAVEEEAYRQSTKRRELIDEQFSAAKFKTAEAKLTMRTGEKKLVAKGPSIGGLVVHRETAKAPSGETALTGETYVVTHAASGLRAGDGFTSQKDAKVAAMRLSQYADFAQKDPVKSIGIGGASVLGDVARKLKADPYAELPPARFHPKTATPESSPVESAPREAAAALPATEGDRVQVNDGPLKGKTVEVTKAGDTGVYVRGEEGPVKFVKNGSFEAAPKVEEPPQKPNLIGVTSYSNPLFDPELWKSTLGYLKPSEAAGQPDLRARTGELARKQAVLQEKLKKERRRWRGRSDGDMLAFADLVENGEADRKSRGVTLTPKTQAMLDAGKKSITQRDHNLAATLRVLLDEGRKAVQDLGTGKLQNFIENYFPHIWEQKGSKVGAAFGMVLGKRPLEGPKSFLKKREIPTTAEGFDKDLRPVTTNPVDMAIVKMYEMNRFVMAHRLRDDMKAAKTAQFVSFAEKAPEGWKPLDDKVFTVYGNPDIPVKEYYDEAVWDSLHKLAKNLGIDHERKVNIGGTRLGYTQQGSDEIVTRFATPEQVIAHEIGHQMDWKYGLKGKLVKTSPYKEELRKLVDLKWEGKDAADVPQSFKRYIRKGEEKMAAMIETLVHAPEKFKEAAPQTWKFLQDFIADKPELKPLLNVKPSMKFGVRTGTVNAGGMVIHGRYYAPEGAATPINRYVASGLKGIPLYDVVRGFGNSLNQVQLGLSGFHLGTTSLNAVISQYALATKQLAHGQIVKSAVNFLTAPAAPIRNLIQGGRGIQAYLRPDQIGPYQRLARAAEQAGGRAGMGEEYIDNRIEKMLQSFANKKYFTGILQSIPAAVEAQAIPVLKWIVPRMKYGAFMDLAADIYERAEKKNWPKEQIRSELQKSWDSIDNRFGQVVYDNLNWNKMVKDLAFIGVRSVGWNYGTWRELGGGVRDAAAQAGAAMNGKGFDVTDRMAYSFMLPITIALLGALYMYAHTKKWPENTKDYFFPKNGKREEDGTEARSSLPSYMKDVFSMSQHPVDTSLHKINPGLSVMIEMLENKDYYGNEIRNTDDPAMAQLWQAVGHVGKSFLPFTLRNMQKQKQIGEKGIEPKLETFMGITPAARNIERTDAESLAHELIQRRAPAGAHTAAEQKKRERIFQLEQDARSGALTLDALKNRMAKGEITKEDVITATKNISTPGLVRSFKELTIPEALKVWDVASPKERDELKVLLAEKSKGLLKMTREDQLVYAPLIGRAIRQANAQQKPTFTVPFSRRTQAAPPEARP